MMKDNHHLLIEDVDMAIGLPRKIEE